MHTYQKNTTPISILIFALRSYIQSGFHFHFCIFTLLNCKKKGFFYYYAVINFLGCAQDFFGKYVLQKRLTSNESCIYFVTFVSQYTKAGSEQKVKGQRIEIFKNLNNIFLINNQHSLKSYQIGNIEIFSKEVFFRPTTFFFG